jgi:hypothetical protein
VNFKPARLRGGEWIIGVASLALLVCLFALPWYGLTHVFSPTAATLGLQTDANGWNSLEVLRWLILLLGAGGIAVWWLQATRQAPSLPVAATALESVLGAAVLIALLVRVVIDPPGSSSFIEPKSGAIAGLVLSAVLLIGGYLSLREDGIDPQDAPASIELLRLAQRGTAPAR